MTRDQSVYALKKLGGIYMKVEPTEGGSGVNVSVESHPLPLAVTFSQYVELWKRLAKHYHPFRLVRYVMLGRVLDTIPRAHVHSTT